MLILYYFIEIALRELRLSLENEKRRQIIEVKRQSEQEKLRAVEDAKKKQWCARCQREAQFYCCWNTSYCGYHCQVSLTSIQSWETAESKYYFVCLLCRNNTGLNT